MTWEPRPVPEPSPETARFWEAAAEGRLLLSECQECGFAFHYPRAFCPECFSDDVKWLEADGEGDLYTYATMEKVVGWPEEFLPLTVAYVEVDEGPRVLTNVVDCEPSDLSIGTRVSVSFVETEDVDIGIPVFTPK
jgi:uncharacterized OB-fold protein